MMTLLLLLSVLVASVRASVDAKMRNGAPLSFAAHRVPSPAAHAEREHGALHEIRTSSSASSASSSSFAVLSLLADSATGNFAFTVVAPHVRLLTLALTAPNGTSVRLADFQTASSWPLADAAAAAETLPALTFRLHACAVGAYELRIEVPTSARAPHALPNGAVGLVVTMNESPISIVSHINSYELEVGHHVGLVTRVTDDVAWSVADVALPAALLSAIDSAKMVVIAPDGVESQYDMHDDGLHGDALANDGVFAATFVPAAAGAFVWFAHVHGTTPAGVPFQRTTEHLVRIASVDAELTGKARLTTSGARLRASIGVAPGSAGAARQQSSAAPLLSVYAELWTVAGVPVGWAATAATPANGAVELSWDSRWLADAGVTSGDRFELRNVYISEMDGFVPLSQRAVIAPAHSRALDVAAALAVAATRSGDEKFNGERPAWVDRHLQARLASVAAPAPVVLSHGYCSDANPFLATPSAWTDYHTFTDFGKSRSNDEFARLILAFAQSKGLDSGFAGVGHSQGGIALTHLACTYWSGLDTTRLAAHAKNNATFGAGSGDRVVQSVGTPYKGCSGAGSGASLIKIFGIGCGSNDDLTPDGAALWLSTISSTCAADVYYYTTTYKLKGGSWLGEWCNLATSLVLEAPNDGTTELVYADLPGGNNMGNTEKQCHIDDMVYPAQTSDLARNTEMNKRAGGRQ
jgi:hypothetical protein